MALTRVDAPPRDHRAPVVHPAASALSIRAVAIEQAVAVRALHRTLVAEFESTVAPGYVLALAVRGARTLQRQGCSAELLPAATEQLVRACLLARSRGACT